MRPAGTGLLHRFVVSRPMTAAESGPLAPIERGMKACLDSGAKAAVQAWIQGSALAVSKEVLSQANRLKQIEDFYGAFEGYKIPVEKRSVAESIWLWL